MKKYQESKAECQKKIKGVCEGCGGKLSPIKTVNNSGEPTYWVGCEHCSCFRVGIDRKYWEIARKLIENNELVPYSHMRRSEYENTPEELDYWLDTQTSGLSLNIRRIDYLLNEKK